MNDNNRFNHIKVSPAEEEDVVIYAGAPSADSQQTPAKVTHEASSDYLDASLEDEVADISAFEGADTQDDDASQAPVSDARTRTSRSEDDSYQETTLEDIESSKMSVTQKAIIVIAVLAVIAFVVYSILFM